MYKLVLINALVLFCQFIHAAPITLNAVEKNLEINGKTLSVYDLVQDSQKEGVAGIKGHWFDVLLKNKTRVPISIHWHGLILPNDQDGIPYVTQLPIQPGQSKHYRFKLSQAGTFWMHSHYKFHEQLLMAAPLIINDAKETSKEKEVIVMLGAVTYKKPETIFYDLQHKKPMQMNMQMNNAASPDLNDVNFDAYIANRKTLRAPDVVLVKAGERVKLRVINGATASNFWVTTGKLQGKAIAVDGNGIQPFLNEHFQLAVAQRIDIEVDIPKTGGVFPILAQVEGTTHQTGIILATKDAKVPPFQEEAENVVPALNNEQEQQIHAKAPLMKKPIQAVLRYQLTGDMQKYIWKINDEIWPHIKPLKIKKGDRVEMVFMNNTSMAHPMHFHGHIFQVTEINDKPLINGPVRDTILVLPHTTEKIVFDADNPGIWMMHCHVLYHMAAGMMTTTNYIDYPEPVFYQKLIGQSQ